MSKEYSVKVSVIMPAFNAGAYIQKALESVLNQTEHDFEVIVSDDFSTDNTVAVAEAMAEKDCRIKLIKSNQNRGPAYSRNRAISEANGQWIALLDADDFYHKDRLKALVNIGEEYQADVVADNIYYVNEVGDNPVIAVNHSKNNNKHEIISTSSFIQNDLPGKLSFSYGTLQPIIRRNFLYFNNITYDENARLGEDFILYIECLLNGAKFVFNYDAFYYYRSVRSSITKSNKENILLLFKNNNSKLIKTAEFKNNEEAMRLLKYRQKLLDRAILYSEISKQLKDYQVIGPFKKVIMHPESWLYFYIMLFRCIKRKITK